MKIAHLILAHKNPKQLERLIKALNYSGFTFYIHLDKKADMSEFLFLERASNIFFIKKRTKIYWAGYGTIQATLNGFQEIIPENYDYINVISAQDFPIKSPSFIHNYICEKKGKQFITCQSIETEWQEAAHRIKKYHFINWRIPGKFRLQKIVNKILPERKFPLDHVVVGRANWFTLTNDACEYIISFLKKNPKLVRYYKYCWGADEFIFSTIIYNSQFRDQIEDNLVYVDWTGQTQGHPRILNASDFEALKKSDKLFARKFDSNVDDAILQLLENWIRQ